MYLFNGYSYMGLGESRKKRRSRAGNVAPLSMPKAENEVSESSPPIQLPSPMVKPKPIIKQPVINQPPILTPVVAPVKSEALPKELIMATSYSAPTSVKTEAIVPTNAPSTIVAPPVLPFFVPGMRVAPPMVAAPAPIPMAPPVGRAAVVASLSPTSVTPQQARIGITSTAAALALLFI